MACYHTVKDTLATDREPTEAELKIVRRNLDSCVAQCAVSHTKMLPQLDAEIRAIMSKIE